VSFGRGADEVSDPLTAGVSFRDRVFHECLLAFPDVTFTVKGHCMRPDLVDGQRVRVVGPTQRKPRLGDVVLTRRADHLRLHRLVWKPLRPRSRTGWRTMADRGTFLDPSLTEGDVIGTVVAVDGRAYARRPWRALRSLLSAVLGRSRSVCARPSL
jgi:hypothetical protein